ncbi:MAG TPA: cytochrome P450 [Marmoricola sp.]|nr:cytochrome P450 [Marmoricola sp.]
MSSNTLLRMRSGVQENVHWLAANGVPRLVLRLMARRGDLQGRINFETVDGADPWELLEEVRAAGPMVKGPLGFMSADYQIVREVLSSSDFRSGNPVLDRGGPIARLATRTMLKTVHPLRPPSLLVIEPPQHTRYRKLVRGVFTNRAVEKLRTQTEEITSDLLDGLSGGDPVDIIAAYCSQLPVAVIAEILGVPVSERELVLRLATVAAPALDFGLSWQQSRRVEASLREFDNWLDGHLTRLRSHPGDDLLSELVHARDEFGPLTMPELKATAGLLLAAGFETTVNLLGNGISLLTNHREQLEILRQQPELWGNAVEEVLRFDPPVLLTGRVTDSGASIGGRRIPAGSSFVTLLAGANRDPQVFANPELFDVTRENAREHLSFSLGRHHCLGASLARMEGEIGLRMLFDRFPDLDVAAGGQRRPTQILRGWESLPVLLGNSQLISKV